MGESVLFFGNIVTPRTLPILCMGSVEHLRFLGALCVLQLRLICLLPILKIGDSILPILCMGSVENLANKSGYNIGRGHDL